MKITKSQLKQLILEEMQNVLNEARGLGGEDPPTPGDIKFSGQYDQGFDDEAEDLEPGSVMDLSGFELKKIRNGMYNIIDSETGESVLGPFRTESQAQDRMSDPGLAADYEAAKQITSTRAGDYSSYKVD